MTQPTTQSAPSRPPRRALPSERIAGAVMTVLAICSAVHLFSLESGGVEGDPGPTLFPGIATAGLGICGVLIALKPAATTSEDSGGASQLSSGVKVAVYFVALLVGYVLVLQLAGYYVATPLFLLAAYWMLTDKEQLRWGRVALFTVIVTVVVAVIFTQAINIVLPMGVF